MKPSFIHFISGMLLCLVPGISSGQIKTEQQPAAFYYDSLKAICLPKVMTEEKLLAEKVQALPAGFLDSLKKYDWYEVASYHYSEKKYASSFSTVLSDEKLYANVQLNFKRFEADGTQMEMFLDRRKNGDFAVYTTTFDKATATKLKDVKPVNGQARMITEIFGEEEKQKIVSFHDGILVIEISINPEIQTDKKYRIEWVAVPKMF